MSKFQYYVHIWFDDIAIGLLRKSLSQSVVYNNQQQYIDTLENPHLCQNSNIIQYYIRTIFMVIYHLWPEK